MLRFGDKFGYEKSLSPFYGEYRRPVPQHFKYTTLTSNHTCVPNLGPIRSVVFEISTHFRTTCFWESICDPEKLFAAISKRSRAIGLIFGTHSLVYRVRVYAKLGLNWFIRCWDLAINLVRKKVYLHFMENIDDLSHITLDIQNWHQTTRVCQIWAQSVQ